MAVEERDPVSGRKTTGHEWNGIKELDTAVPRGVLIFIDRHACLGRCSGGS